MLCMEQRLRQGRQPVFYMKATQFCLSICDANHVVSRCRYFVQVALPTQSPYSYRVNTRRTVSLQLLL